MLLLALACTKTPVTADTSGLPKDLAPLEKNQASYPVADGDTLYPETINLVKGEERDYDWVHGRGYVHADLLSTWEAMQDPLVMLDRRMVAEWSVQWDNRPDYPVSFKTHNVVVDIITIEFDMDWWQDQVPDGRIAGRYEKTEGTSIIERLEGGFLLIPIGQDVTAIETIGRVKALQRSADPVENYWRDVYWDVVATVHGEELPELN